MGTYKLKIGYKNPKDATLNLKISSQGRTEATFPFKAKCWVNGGKFLNCVPCSKLLQCSTYSIADTAGVNMKDGPLTIVAQVTQGNKPIMNAKVE